MAEVTTGFAPFKVGDQTYQTWYKIYGKLGGGRRPIVALHGGGGMTHHYMLPHTILVSRLDSPVIFYDQLGNGGSTHLRDVPKEFWKAELWVDELDNLLRHLGIVDDFDLIGNSWGGMLGSQYAASRTPAGLKGLVISNSPASIPLFKKGIESLLSKSPEQADILRKHAEAGTFTSSEYQGAAQVLNDKHFCRLAEKPKDFVDSVMSVVEDPTVYSTMVGPSIYHLNGQIATWSIIDQLPNIRCPTLVISSPHDLVQPLATLPWFQKINQVKWVELQNSSHMPMFEEPDRYFDVLVAFFARDDASKSA